MKKDVEMKDQLQHLERGPSRHSVGEPGRDPGAGRPNCCNPKDAIPIVNGHTVGSEGYACTGGLGLEEAILERHTKAQEVLDRRVWWQICGQGRVWRAQS